jgi:hypothetical protein
VAAGNGKGGNDRGNGRVFYTIVTANTLLRFSSDKPHKLRAKQITGLPVGVSIKRIDFRPASGDLYAARQQQGRVPAGPEDGHAVPEGPTFDRVPSILNGDNTGFDTPSVHSYLCRSAQTAGKSPSLRVLRDPARAGPGTARDTEDGHDRLLGPQGRRHVERRAKPLRQIGAARAIISDGAEGVGIAQGLAFGAMKPCWAVGAR